MASNYWNDQMARAAAETREHLAHYKRRARKAQSTLALHLRPFAALRAEPWAVFNAEMAAAEKELRDGLARVYWPRKLPKAVRP